MCVLSEALNVASQWCGVGPVSERWVQSMPLASLCCAHVCAAMRNSPVVVLGDYKAPGGKCGQVVPPSPAAPQAFVRLGACLQEDCGKRGGAC